MFSILLISSLMVISSLNFTHAIFWLVLVFVLSAAYFLTLKYFYVGLIILIIYVGALAILFLFVIMLLDSQTFTKSAERFNFIPISLVAGLCFFLEIKRTNFQNTFFSFNFTFLLLKMFNNIETLGWHLYYNYFYSFLIACYILLIAMLGAILTQKIKLEVKNQKPFIQTVRTVKEDSQTGIKLNLIQKKYFTHKKEENNHSWGLKFVFWFLFFMVGMMIVKLYFCDPIYAQDLSWSQELVIRIQSIIAPSHVDINTDVFSYIRDHRNSPMSGFHILNYFHWDTNDPFNTGNREYVLLSIGEWADTHNIILTDRDSMNVSINNLAHNELKL